MANLHDMAKGSNGLDEQYYDDTFDEEGDETISDDAEEGDPSPNGCDSHHPRLFSKSASAAPRQLLHRRSKAKPVRLSRSAERSAKTYVSEVIGPTPSPILLSITSSLNNESRAASSAKFIQDRINSAKLKSRKERMNSIHSLQREISELKEENKLLNRQVRRQDLELSRLEGARGELPTVLHAHNEEVRVLKEKIKKFQESNKDLEAKLNRRDGELFKMREANRGLTSLTHSKKLDEREKLQMELDDLKSQLEDRDVENRNLRHKLTITEKSFKQQMSNERGKYNVMVKKLGEAEGQINKLRKEVKEKEKIISRTNIYAHRLNRSRSPTNLSTSSSMMSLTNLVDREEDSGGLPTPTGQNQLKSGKSTPGTYTVLNEGKSYKRAGVKSETIEKLFKEIDDLKAANAKVKEDIEKSKEITQEPSKPVPEALTENGNGTPKLDATIEEKEEEEKGQTSTDDFFDNLVAKESDTNRPSSLRNVRRQNSFVKTRQFFENQGTIIEEKDYTKSNVDDDEAKMTTWLPKPMSSAKSSRSGSLESKGSPGKTEGSRQGSLTLSATKRAGLLAQLEQIDQDGKPGVYDKSLNMGERRSSAGYSPSFGPAPKQRETTLMKRNSVIGTGESSFNADQAPSSPAASITSRKSALMKELFG